MPTVFLSHSHLDKPFARRLANDLRLAGHGVWIDEAEINIGDSLIQKIRDGLDQVDFVAAILSQSSINSPWVTRELDIASNREIDEQRVVVLPVLVEDVDLPGFLRGKFYGDFRDNAQYDEKFKLLLRAIGPASSAPKPSAEELEQIRAQLSAAQAVAAQHQAQLHAHQAAALHGKSERLKHAIEEANQKFPAHAAINTTHAFETAGFPVTLDYLFWAIAKADRRGTHQLEVLLTIDEKWPAVTAILSAYEELLSAAGG
ncbi:toll/interleukin-1 receptor domain-containing protein [Xanthomonas arboricola]|uniref:toll/interleukin-1 receptor domain-containing protein n=1 Tax=Xanthomonas arboricola TaxID=56448 RepID=UPI000E0F868B|nr:toll/interleukin-1 receptor domain-containing protein [Xanthomonas arboricola]